MFFVLSKILGLLFEPLVVPYLLLGLSAIARWRRRKTARLLFIAALLVPLVYCVYPLSSLPLQFLENRIQRGNLESHQIDGIIVLGGFTGDGAVAENRNSYMLNASAERFTATLALARQFPDIPILFSGFSGQLVHQGWSEADQIRDLLQRLGGLSRAVLYEEQSRNTYENAVNSQKILAAAPGSRWILVTSASHMPRAVGSFAAAGWTGIIPYPVDYQTISSGSQRWWSRNGITALRTALHEYAGLLVYYITGRSSSLLPR